MLKSSTNKMISFCKSRGKQSCDMVRKKCALVACVRVCAQNISREEWFSVPSRTVHPPAHQQKYCPSRGKSKDVGLHFKIIVCVSLKNVIRPPTYQQKNVIRPPTYQKKCISKCYPSTYLPTKKMLSVRAYLPMLSVRLPTKNVGSHHLPAFQNVYKLIAQLSCV